MSSVSTITTPNFLELHWKVYEWLTTGENSQRAAAWHLYHGNKLVAEVSRQNPHDLLWRWQSDVVSYRESDCKTDDDAKTRCAAAYIQHVVGEYHHRWNKFLVDEMTKEAEARLAERTEAMKTDLRKEWDDSITETMANLKNNKPSFLKVSVVIAVVAFCVIIAMEARISNIQRELQQEHSRNAEVADTMRQIGICRWRDKLHQIGRDSLWMDDPSLNAQVSIWCSEN